MPFLISSRNKNTFSRAVAHPSPARGRGAGEEGVLRNEFIPLTYPGARTQAGFSLVEILVGLVIGLLASLVIMQVFSVFEGQKRATTGSADAQVNGSIALYNIKRDTESAGFGLPVFSSQNTPLKCTTLPTFDHDGNAATPVIDMFPVVITDGGGGLSDTIAIRYGRTASAGIPSLATIAGTTATFTTNNNMGCQADDWAIISSGSTCAMVQVANSLLSPATRTDWVTMPLTSTPAVLSGSMACIGKYQKDSPYDDHSSPLEYLYWVDNGNLAQGGNPATAGSGAPIVAGIVNLQAQYGVSATAASNQITQWVDATGAWAAPIAMADRNRIKAIRIAVVARNGNTLEKTNVTNACSSTTGSNPTGLCAWDGSGGSAAPSIDLSADANWQRYRYRVFDTIIPLRSMIWSKDKL